MHQRWVRLLAVVVFLGFTLVLVFGYYRSNSGDPDNFPALLQIVVPLVVYFTAGFAIGRWWFIPLMLVPILIAIPAGPIPSDDDGLPIDVAVAVVTLVYLRLLGIAGVIARKLRDHSSPHRPPPSQPDATG
jgi:hypothetical protein